MKARSKPLERNKRISEEGANCSKETRGFRQRLENLTTRSKPLERSSRISGGANRSRERLENFEKTRDSENTEQTTQKELEGFRGSKPLERDFRISKVARAFEARSTLLERN